MYEIKDEFKMHDIFFTDRDHGWSVGVAGTVLRTSDGGKRWAPQTGGAANWLGVFFVDPQNGWIIGRGGTIRRTTNGGETWIAQSRDGGDSRRAGGGNSSNSYRPSRRAVHAPARLAHAAWQLATLRTHHEP